MSLRGGGYYLAMSDYWDLSLTGDWYSKGGFKAESFFRYSKRYDFTGSVRASYGRQTFNIGNVNAPDDPPRTEYRVELTHNQEIDPTSRVNVNFTFMTDSYYQNFSNDLDNLLNQTARSTANYSKSWEGTNRSMSVNISRDQNLIDGTWQMTLPDVAFNQSQIFPFKKKGSGLDQSWYELIGFNYSGRGLGTFQLKDISSFDDTIPDLQQFARQGVDHRLSLIASPKLGYFTISPSFSYRERWYPHWIERSFNSSDSSITPTEVNGFKALRTFTGGVTANTKIYGMFTPDVLGILGVRHTLQPAVNYRWNPDFSEERWGYYLSYLDEDGQEVRYDPYTGYDYLPGEVFGGVSSGESQTIGLALQNIFEMKMKPAENDTTMTPRKFQLFTLNASTNYNIVKDSMNLAPLTLSYRTSIQNFLDIYGGATFTPYVWEPTRYETGEDGRLIKSGGHEVDRYLIDEGMGLGRMTNFNINLSTTLNSELFRTGSPKEIDTTAIEEMREELHRDAGATYDFPIPWNLSIGYNFSQSQSNPEFISRNSGVRFDFRFSLTPNWHFTASTMYNIVEKEIGAPRLSIRRDLHCWEMVFNWIPSGTYRSFDFTLRIKAPQLQDLKLEKQGSERSVY